MATLPGTPRTWTDGEVVTEAMMDAEIRDSMKYLKGTSGTRAFDGVVQTNYSWGVGLANASPPVGGSQAKLDVRENGSVYAAIVENEKTSGTPGGLQVVSRLNSSQVVLGAYSGGVGIGLTERFAILGNGTLRANGVTIWEQPLYAQATNDWPLTGTFSFFPGMVLTIPRVGWWEFFISIAWDMTWNPSQIGQLAYYRLTDPSGAFHSSRVSQSAHRQTASSSYAQYTYRLMVNVLQLGNVSIDVRKDVALADVWTARAAHSGIVGVWKGY